MSNLSENFKSSYKNFKQYAKHGTVPVAENNGQVPQNSFYKSLYHIDSVVGPVKDMLVGVNKDTDASTTTLGKREEKVCGTRHNGFYSSFANLFLVLYTGFAYLTHLPKKLFSHLKGTDSPKSLREYANDLQHTAEKHGNICAEFLSLVLSCIMSAVIWTAALVVTPLTWAVDKVSSKLSNTNSGAVDHNTVTAVN